MLHEGSSSGRTRTNQKNPLGAADHVAEDYHVPAAGDYTKEEPERFYFGDNVRDFVVRWCGGDHDPRPRAACEEDSGSSRNPVPGRYAVEPEALVFTRLVLSAYFDQAGAQPGAELVYENMMTKRVAIALSLYWLEQGPEYILFQILFVIVCWSCRARGRSSRRGPPK